MKKILFALATISSTNIFAVNYSFCQNAFNVDQHRVPSKSGLAYFPFELKDDGTINPHPDFNSSNFGSTTILTGKKGTTSENIEVKISHDDKGRISNVQRIQTSPFKILKNASSNIEKKTLSITSNESLIYDGDTCAIQQFSENYKYGDILEMGGVVFDFQLCKDVNKFFKDNPEAESCFDKNSKLTTASGSILRDFYNKNLPNKNSNSFVANKTNIYKLDRSQLSGVLPAGQRDFYMTEEDLYNMRHMNILNNHPDMRIATTPQDSWDLQGFSPVADIWKIKEECNNFNYTNMRYATQIKNYNEMSSSQNGNSKNDSASGTVGK